MLHLPNQNLTVKLPETRKFSGEGGGAGGKGDDAGTISPSISPRELLS